VGEVDDPEAAVLREGGELGGVPEVGGGEGVEAVDGVLLVALRVVLLIDVR
jgi:hypothetical protein